MLHSTTLLNSAADWRIVVQQCVKFYAVHVNTPNRFCLTRCDIINYNDVTSATNPYVFEENVLLQVNRLLKKFKSHTLTLITY